MRNTWTGDRVCVSCFTFYSQSILASSYNDKCPEVTRQIIVKENAKWFNSELREDLRAVGIEDDVHKWYKSYLENRKVTVVTSNVKSEKKGLTK